MRKGTAVVAHKNSLYSEVACVVREQVELVGVHLELLFIHGVEEAFDLLVTVL